MDAALDHLVYAVPDLARGVAEFRERTGVQPVPGGSHAGRGTANALVGLGGAAYLEIIGPDPAQPDFDGVRPFAVSSTSRPAVVTWAVRPADLDATVASARAGGYDPGEVQAMSRRTPDGELLRWRLSVPADAGLVPFLIDWGDTPHPTTRDLPVTPLVSFTGVHPDPPRIQGILALLDVDLTLAVGAPAGFAVTVRGRDGDVPL